MVAGAIIFGEDLIGVGLHPFAQKLVSGVFAGTSAVGRLRLRGRVGEDERADALREQSVEFHDDLSAHR